jgi:hypothetical protein
MIFQASAELHEPASSAYVKVSRNANRFILDRIENSSLVKLDCTLLYVPIIMPEKMHIRYRARSRLLRAKKTYECCPHLDYSKFLTENFDIQMREYIDGLAASEQNIAKLGASEQQIKDFVDMLLDAKKLRMSH